VGLFSLTLLVSALPETGYACALPQMNLNLLKYFSQAVSSSCNPSPIVAFLFKKAVGPTSGEVAANKTAYAKAAQSLMNYTNVPVAAMVAAEYEGKGEKSEDEIDRAT